MLERPPSRPDQQRERRAEAQRRYRRNIADHARVAPVRYTATMLNYLVRLKWLDDADTQDCRKVGEAIERALKESEAAER
jgi:hypothetical protein